MEMVNDNIRNSITRAELYLLMLLNKENVLLQDIEVNQSGNHFRPAYYGEVEDLNFKTAAIKIYRSSLKNHLPPSWFITDDLKVADKHANLVFNCMDKEILFFKTEIVKNIWESSTGKLFSETKVFKRWLEFWGIPIHFPIEIKERLLCVINLIPQITGDLELTESVLKFILDVPNVRIEKKLIREHKVENDQIKFKLGQSNLELETVMGNTCIDGIPIYDLRIQIHKSDLIYYLFENENSMEFLITYLVELLLPADAWVGPYEEIVDLVDSEKEFILEEEMVSNTFLGFSTYLSD